MADTENHLIERLPLKDRTKLLAVCEPVQLVMSEVLCQPDEPTSHVYFPVDGFISVVATIDGHAGVEVGMIGREGMLGAQLALGVSVTPLCALVQGAGSCWRIGSKSFQRELAGSAALRQGMHSYIHVLMAQLASSAACLRHHMIGPRLARWLLMSQDRAHSSGFHVTHEFLGYMLGVRRVGITTAAMGLQRKGLIEYRRGEIKVLDRHGLKAAACSCYASDLATYAAFLP